MNEPRCEMCGKPATPTPLGSLLCAGCQARYREFHCGRCGQRVMYLGECAADHPELAAGTCSLCHMREWAAALPAADRDAILATLDRGTLPAVKEVRERLGWSINEAVSLVHVLRDSAEPGAAADRGPTG